MKSLVLSGIAAVAMMANASGTRAETLVTVAKIVETTERGFILLVGTEPLATEDSADTQWWFQREPAKRGSYKVGDTVQVRIKTDSDPPMLREVADAATGKWLEGIRKNVQKATVERIDSKFLHVVFADGSKFAYRITEKSEIKLSNKAGATASDLQKGLSIYIKGRLLPTLDTWADEITDTAPVAKPTTGTKPTAGSGTKAAPKPKPVKLPASGKIEAVVLSDLTTLKMFDVLVNEIRTYHISYNLETKFYVGGKASDRRILVRGMKVLVSYKRDQYGRLIASKVEAFPSP